MSIRDKLLDSTCMPANRVKSLDQLQEAGWEEFDPLNPAPIDPSERVAVTIEPLLNLRAIANKLQLPYFKVLRAAKSGTIPTYKFANTRRLARLSEVVAVINRSRQGGVA